MNFWKLASILPVAVAILAGCGGKEERKAMHLEKGIAFYDEANYDKARIELRNVLQIDPKTPEAYFLIGLIDEEQQNWPSAFNMFRKVIELEPNHVEARQRLGRLYLLSGRLDEAESELNEMVARQPQFAGARFLKAAIAARRGDVAGAISEAQAAVDADPSRVDAVSLLAGLHTRNGELAKAQAVLEKGISANARSVPLRTDLAAVLVRQNKRDKAEEIYKAVVNLEPRVLRHRSALAGFYMHTNQPAKAEAVLRDAVAADPEDDLRLLMLVEHLAQTGGAQRAEAELVEAIQARPRAYQLRFSLARLYQVAGDPAKAERVYREIVDKSRMEPDGLRARAMLARTKLTTGDVAEAEKLIADVLSENPRDSAALEVRARIALAKGQPQESIADLRSVLKDHPESIELVTLLAVAYSANNEPQLAKDAFDNAIVRYPGNASLRLALADFLVQTGQPDPALRESEAVLAGDAQNARAYELKAQAQSIKGDARGAEETLKQLKSALPDHVAGPLQLGLLYHSQKKPDAAIAEFEVALNRAPNAIEPLTALVNLLVEQGRVDRAIARVQQTIERTPRNQLARLSLANLYTRQKKYDAAEAELRRVIELNPRLPGPYVGLAQLAQLRGDQQSELALLEQGLRAMPGDAWLSTMLAEARHRRGEFDAAIAEYEKILARNPAFDVAANNLAAILAESKRDKASLDRALTLARRFENSTNPTFQDTLGWIYAQLGNTDRAVTLLRSAVAAAPADAAFQYHLGMALYNKGDFPAAKQHLQAATKGKAAFPGRDEAAGVLAKI